MLKVAKTVRIVMDVDECIKGRRSVRSYLDKPVEGGKIDAILDAGAMAPSAMNRQPCRFTVVEKKEKIRELSDKTKNNVGLLGVGLKIVESLKVKEDVIFYNAPLLIVISIPKEQDGWSKLDCALAAENMMLKAFSMGLGSCYIGFARSLNNDKEALKDLEVPKDYEIMAPLIFGYPKDWPKPKEKKAKVLKWIK
ncbi:MAG: nitroreductase family protein [Candidatus Altiarchaeota archaeon]